MKDQDQDQDSNTTTIYFSACTWADNQDDMFISESMVESRIHIGSVEVKTPAFPEPDVWKLMVQGHTLEQAKLAVAQCSMALMKAKENLDNLTCLEHIPD